MWIKLVSPKMTMRPMDTELKTRMSPPMALLALAALTPDNHRVTIGDENVEKLRLDDRPDLVGITVKADTARRANEIAARYRARGVPVVFGGIHPTSWPEGCLEHADAVAIGDAERTWPEIVRDCQWGGLKRVYRQDGPTDLAEAPVPAWDLLEGKDYLITNTVLSGRGCPFRCDFCYSSAEGVWPGHRSKPIKNVLREIEALGTRHVFFPDDNFIGEPARARELLRAMRPLGLTWHTAVSADIGRHGDILDLMAETGCKSLFIGFETISQENLASCNKRQNKVGHYERTIRKVHERGMMINSSVVFGFDGDGPEVFRDTVDWLCRNKVETMTAHILTPYPGTAFHARLEAEGRIVDRNFDHYNTSRAVFEPRGMTRDELESGYLWAYREFYSLGRIMERLPEARPQRAAFLMFNILYRRLGPLTAALGRLGVMGPMARLAKSLAYPEKARQASGKLAAATRRPVFPVKG